MVLVGELSRSFLGRYHCKQSSPAKERPGWKRSFGGRCPSGSEYNSEGAGANGPMVPELPELGGKHILALNLAQIAHPKQLQIRIGEEEPAIGRALTGMSVRGPFQQTSLCEEGRLRGARRATNEDVIEFGAHDGVT